MYDAETAHTPHAQRDACVDFSVTGENQTALNAVKNTR